MVKISEIDRTATFAWSRDTLPLLVTGTMAGAISADFSSSSELAIYDPLTGSEPLISHSVDSKFYSIVWSLPTEKYKRGVVACAFESGAVKVFDASLLLEKKPLSEALIKESNSHSGPVRCVAFSEKDPQLMASGGPNGEIFVWNTSDNSEPVTAGSAITSLGDVTCVAWNRCHPHILAATGTSGFVTVWDLKSHKEVMHFSYADNTAKAVFSCVQWHPSAGTKLVTASETDALPVLTTWDLRNANVPEKILRGHTLGVLSLDWCMQDPSLLLSSGKDNSVLLWNPIEGVKLGKYPKTSNWVFKAGFAPGAPDLLASSSFDGKVLIQTLQDTSSVTEPEKEAIDENDFFNQISETTTAFQPEIFVKQAPKWMLRPCGATFAYGGQLVSAKGKDVLIKNVKELDLDLKTMDEDNLQTVCEERLSAASTEQEKQDWSLLDSMFKEDKLKFFKDKVGMKQLSDDVFEQTNEPAQDEDFYKSLKQPDSVAFVPSGSFSLYQDDVSPKLTNALLLKELNKAADLCLAENKISDALVIALLEGSQEVKDKVKTAYFKQNHASSLSRLLYNISNNSLLDVVENADIADWQKVAASILKSNTTDLQPLMSRLGDRVLKSEQAEGRNNAIACYLAGGALDKACSMWLEELSQTETSQDGKSPIEAHFGALTKLVEKITVSRSALNITGPFSGSNLQSISKVYLEYVRLLSDNGEFVLANKFLSLLPDSEDVKLEKTRLAAALPKQAPRTNPVAQKSAQSVTPQRVSQRGPHQVPHQVPQQIPQQAPQQVQPKSYIPAPSHNPYKPTNGFMQPSVAAQPQLSTPVLPPKPQRDEGGWNDLPAHISQSAAPQRGSMTASPYTAALQQAQTSTTPPPPVGPSRTPVPPPPGKSRSGSAISTPALTSANLAAFTAAPPKPPQAMPSMTRKSSRYAPEVAPVEQKPPPSVYESQAARAAPNPYAPTPVEQSLPNPYAPPAAAGIPSQPQITEAVIPPPPRNPYAPPPASSNISSPRNVIPQPQAIPAPPSMGNAPSVGRAPSVVQSPVMPPKPAQTPVQQKYPPGDRSHIPSSAAPVFDILTSELEVVKPKIPEKFSKQLKDAEKRINILFDHLNNDDLLTPDAVQMMGSVCQQLVEGNFTESQALLLELATQHSSETGNWMVGVKRLINMSEAVRSM